jgi:hypothetical protein
MKGMLAVLLSILITVICWGVYGPVLHNGQHDMGSSSWRPFICVGMAYFVIAVIAPVAWLQTKGESGQWSTQGVLWSLAAGAAGAIGALGIILAFAWKGSPVYVMPLVFGGAPDVNTFLTMYMTKTFKAAGPLFFAGLILVVAGASIVLVFKPKPAPKAVAEHAAPAATDTAHAAPPAETEFGAINLFYVSFFTFTTALAWGVYGPVLHKGQAAMGHSKFRPLICVGVAYFLIAVLVPLAVLSTQGEKGSWDFGGTIWSLAAGSAGAIGALGIIMAFNSGGKPIFVMPLVFGGAPVVNTFLSMFIANTFGSAGAFFYAGLIVVACGAVTVLIFSPKPGKPPAAHPPAEPAPAAGQPA